MSYLILEANSKIVRAPRCERMDQEKTRSELARVFPGRKVLSPLERPNGPIQVVTVYLSRTKDGRARFSQLEQWGIE